ncbi:MAG TPA: energy-coupling factor transporter ATPase [Candidatus Binatia bacterium]|nr:energy-coupling factor transporter ATPase [Candidatus Binatia bacterium]
MEGKIPLELRNVTFSYPSSPEPVLKDINLKVGRGEFVGIVARTGSGKSTLLSLLAGVIPHHFQGELEGEVLLYGEDTRKLSLAKFGVHTGMVLQDPDSQLFNLLVKDEIVWGLENRGVPRAEMGRRLDEVMHFFQLDDFKERITYDLSGGEKQRVVLSSVYISRPSILLLDNPTSQLDPLGAEYVIQSIKQVLETNETVIMVEDKIDELLGHANRLVLLHEGHILLDCAPEEFVRHRELLESVGITPPEIFDLSTRLTSFGVHFSPIPTTLEDAVPAYKHLLNGRAATATEEPLPATAAAGQQRAGARRVKESDDLAVAVRNLSFVYPPPKPIQALKNVNLAFERGSFAAIIGQNGSGKTTLARCMAGYLRPTEGEVIIGGRDVHAIDIYERARRVGYVFQNPETQLFRGSVYDEVLFTLRYQGIKGQEAEDRVRQILEFLDLWERAHLHPFRLSIGDKQRLAIACIAVLRPDALIIDEPTTGQDPSHAWAIMTLLAELRDQFGITVIVITHAMTLAANFCDRVIALCQGEVLLDAPPRETFAQEEKLAQTFVKPPSVTQLALQLGINPPPLNVNEAEAIFKERLRA